MDETYTHLFRCYRDLKSEHKLITGKAIKSRYLGEDDVHRSVMDIIDYHNEDMIDKLKWGTQKNYFTTQKYISKFLLKSYKTNRKSIAQGSLFPRISNQKLNSYLKEIADACGIKKNLTFHIARHTFDTTVTLSNGMPTETVSKLLGHSRISTTQIYAKVIERKVSDDMQRLRNQFKNMEKNSTAKAASE